MAGLDDRIAEIEEEIHKTPYNKATQHHIGKLKAKLAQLRENIQKQGGKGKGVGFAVKKSGDATVALVGFPSVGKSTLLNKLTDANSRVGSYEFTTLDVVPGTLVYAGSKIQMLDIPGIITGASGGKGRGREILSIVRNADLVIIVLDVFQPKHLKTIKKELYDVGIRLGTKPPRVRIKKTIKGGLKITSSVPLKKINKETIREILNINGIHSAELTFHEDVDEDRFIDAVMKNRVYMPHLTVLNKIDMIKPAELDKVKAQLEGDVLEISAQNAQNLESLKEQIFKKLGIIRVYMKPQGGAPDFDEPLIIKKGSRVRDVCEIIHKDIIKKFKYAVIRGKSAKFDDQAVGLDHRLKDADILTIVQRR